MKLPAPCFISLITCCAFFNLKGQEAPGITLPDLELQGSVLEIHYRIENSDPANTFIIRIEVTDEEGKRISPEALSGDIGGNVKGEGEKLIRWDLSADSIARDQVLHVVVVGVPENPPIPDIKPALVTRWGAMGRSVVFPGWGLSRVNPGKPHWIKGIVAYGCLGTSVLMNRLSYTNYENYQSESDPALREAYFDKSVTQENISVATAVAAGAVWLTELVWTLVGTRELAGQGKTAQKGMFIEPGYDPNLNTPLLTLRYTF